MKEGAAIPPSPPSPPPASRPVRRPCEVRPAWNNYTVRREKTTLESKEKQLNLSRLGADA